VDRVYVLDPFPWRDDWGLYVLTEMEYDSVYVSDPFLWRDDWRIYRLTDGCG
jgi:hypothetical protein